MTKLYRVKRDNFLWDKGAILKCKEDNKGYMPESDLWDVTEFNGTEHISKKIIENCPKWFERVYEVNLVKRTVYKLKEEAKAILNKEYSG